MNLQGERIIPASVERTWVALNDPEVLKACIAGCETIEVTGENQFLATMAVRIGPVNAKFKGKLQLSDIVPLQSYKINFDGQGGVAGFGKGSAEVNLSPEGTSGESTRLNYTANAQVGGKIAQIGSRLVESAAAKIAEDFFKAFEARMTAPAAQDVAAVESVAPTDAAASQAAATLPPPTIGHVTGRASATPPAAGAGGNSTLWWIAGIIIIALLAYFFTR
ncbi:MAG: carbon monoxide dehydrogenase subunit G [Lautropia sp.]